MGFTKYLQSKNPGAAMGGAMSGGLGGSFGQLAMQSVQEAGRQRNIGGMMQSNGGQIPGGPSLPATERGDMGQGVAPVPYMNPAQLPQGNGAPVPGQAGVQPQGQLPMPPGYAPGAAQGDPQMQDPEFARGYELGMLLMALQGGGSQMEPPGLGGIQDINPGNVVQRLQPFEMNAGPREMGDKGFTGGIQKRRENPFPNGRN